MALVTHLAALLSLVPALSAQTGGAVEGRIANSVTGEGIPAVAVVLGPTRTYTDDQGAYRIEGLKDGVYRISYTRSGFVLPQTEVPSLTFRVSGNATARFDGTLAPWPSVRGRVVDPEGNPAAGIHVKISRELDDDAVTDDQGTFLFEKIQPGPYTLVATPKAPLAPTFFPSAIERAAAQEIQVQGGADITGYQIQLRSAPAFKIRGVVLDAAGRPVAEAKVTLFQPAREPIVSMPGFIRGPRVIDQDRSASGEDGAFEFPVVYPGEWRVRAESVIGYDDVHRRDLIRSGFRLANVSGRDVENLEVSLADPFAVDFATEGGPPHSPPIFLEALDGPDPGSSLVSGRYVVIAPNRTPGFYVSEVLLGGRNVLNQEFELNGPGTLRAVYKSNGGTVRGTVAHGEGATVLLFSRTPGLARAGLQAWCGAGGAFLLKDVPSGEYEAVAVYIPTGEWRAESLATLLGNGTSVRVEESATMSVELRVTPWP